MTDHLDWTHNVVDIPAAGLTREREATESERKAITGALGLLALDRLSARYRVEAIAGAATGCREKSAPMSIRPASSRWNL